MPFLFTNKLQFKEKQYIWTLLFCCIVIYFGRLHLSESLNYLFMPWNLFLGAVPLFFSKLARKHVLLDKNRFIIPIYTLLWLLFFPNSYYMLTDLYHFNIRTGMPQWYDLLFLLTFAWTGIIMGMISLWDIEATLRHRKRDKWIPYISSFLLFLSGLGIYLGRDLRWNSWDIFTNFFQVNRDALLLFVHPMKYQDAWGLIILMGMFLNMIYWSFQIFRRTM